MNDTKKFEELSAMYSGAVETHADAKRVAAEKKAGGGPVLERLTLELAELEAAHALFDVTVAINHADPALELLRALLISELESGALGFEQVSASLSAKPGPLCDPTPGAVSAKVDALLTSDANGRARTQRDTVCLRLKLVFQVICEAIQLIGAERRVRNLPSPSKPKPFVDFNLNGSPPTNPRECAALIQRIKAAHQSPAEDGLPLAIAEQRTRIRDYLAAEKRKDDDEAKARTESAARKAEEERARRRALEITLAGYAAQDAAAAEVVASSLPLTAEELAAVNL